MTTAIERIAGIGDWRMPITGRRIALSANACRLLGLQGLPPNTLDGLVALCVPEDQHLLREACDRLLKGSEGEHFEVDVRMQVAGRLAWFRHRAEIDPAPQERAPALIGVLQDVSLEKQALQDAIDALKAQVQTERDRLQAASSAGIVGVWDWYIPQNVMVWDEVMYRLYGLKAEDFGGAYEAWSSAVHPEDRAGAEAAIAAALRGEREYDYLFRVVWPSDGSAHFIKAGAHTTFDEHGQAVRMIGVNVDVTEQIAREEALKEATRIAVEANMAKSDFLARMSHEIRTPMNAVIGLSAMGLDLPHMPRRATEYMSRIHQSSTALMGILNDILDFSKIEARQMELDPEEFELEALIESSTELFALSAHQKGLKLSVHVDPALPRFLVGDAPKLGQILNNLLGNAIKFTESGRIFLSVRRMPPGDNGDAHCARLQFSVQDSGIGIAPERLGELFLPFSQADGSIARRYGGSGLGLVISQRLCELMGGRLQVDSQPGVGSTFSFELELPIAEARPVSLDTTRLLHQRVLVVDDQAQERQRVADLLESWGVDAVQAGGGREAIELIARSPGQTGQPFDLVLLDGDMPEMDGLDVSRWILKSAADGHLPRAPAIFLMAAASDREQLIREAGDLQLGAILPKPITASRLWSALSGSRGERPSRTPWPSSPALRRRAAPIAGAHVLLVEDTADSQLVATAMLEHMGLRVTVAGNGQQALEVLRDTAVDIILMDVHMPVMDGLQATRRIREREELADLPVLAMTAAALPRDREDCAAAGMAEVITKPVDPDSLLEALLCWVKRRATPSAVPTAVTPTETDRAAAEAAALAEGFPAIAGIDRLDAAQRLMGNATLFQTLLVTASTRLEFELQAALSAVHGGHRAEAANQIHALCGSLGHLGARDAWALAARTESSLRRTGRPLPTAELQELGQAVTTLATAIRQHLTSQTLAPPRDAQPAAGDHARPAVPYAADLEALLALLDVHDVKALACWHRLQPAIQARRGDSACEPLRAALAALDFTEAARLLRQWEAAA